MDTSVSRELFCFDGEFDFFFFKWAICSDGNC